MSYTDQLSQLTKQYNESIRALKDSYTLERSQSKGWNLTSSHLKKQYSKRYEALEKEYHNKRNELTSLYKNEHPEWAKGRRKWGWTFVIGIVLAMTCCTASLPAEESPINEAITSSSGRTEALSETTYWNADNIPIPYLKDSTQYVSNPDNVLTPQTVERMNVTLQRLNLELGIQSVTIVVNHIENDDPFRMAQDVGNKYGVGHGDKGLIVVVGYEDHSINISPGRSLEGDLTDVECRRLQQEYAVPFMKREQPDSAMIYLIEALYSLLFTIQEISKFATRNTIGILIFDVFISICSITIDTINVTASNNTFVTTYSLHISTYIVNLSDKSTIGKTISSTCPAAEASNSFRTFHAIDFAGVNTVLQSCIGTATVKETAMRTVTGMCCVNGDIRKDITNLIITSIVTTKDRTCVS